MEEWYIIAVLDRSAGNESVGEMWQETKMFPVDTPVFEIIKWAESKKSNTPENFRGSLKLTVGQ